MNIINLAEEDKPVFSKILFDEGKGKVIALKVKHGEKLKEHITTIPAFLICISGQILYKDEQGKNEALLPGDYLSIPPECKHEVIALETSHFLLIK